MSAYTILLDPDDEEGGYTVTVPALPGCITQGETLDEALANAREAIALHLRSMAADGEPAPVDQVGHALSYSEAGARRFVEYRNGLHSRPNGGCAAELAVIQV